MPRQSWQSPGLTRGTSYTDQRVISRIIITFTADQGESPIRSLEDVSTMRSLFQVFHPLHSFTDIPLSCSRLNQGSEGSTTRMFILFTENERTKKILSSTLYCMCTNGILSVSPVGRSFSLLLTLLLLLLTPYPWFIISLTPCNSVTSYRSPLNFSLLSWIW